LLLTLLLIHIMVHKKVKTASNHMLLSVRLAAVAR